MKFFIASPWRNKAAVEKLTEELTTRGHEAYSFLQSGANLSTGRSIAEELKTFGEALQNWEEDPNIKRIFDYELEGLKEAMRSFCFSPRDTRRSLRPALATVWGRRWQPSAPSSRRKCFILFARGFIQL